MNLCASKDQKVLVSATCGGCHLFFDFVFQRSKAELLGDANSERSKRKVGVFL